MSYLTAELLFYAFIFAALAFGGLVFYTHRKWSTVEPEITGLRTELSDTRKELAGARKELAESNLGREKLNKSIDRLIMRRDDLLACLSAARDDKEKVDCIMRLMGEDR